MQKTVRKRNKWKRPPEGKILMNIDGSFRDVQGIGGTGAIIRDSNGSFIAGSCFYLEHVGDASISEIMALKEGLLLAQRIGCSSLIIHSDSLRLWRP
jgi:ribonuclease HI